MAKYFKLANSHEEAVEYWKASQFDLSDIILALTDNGMNVGIGIYSFFQREDFLRFMNLYKFNFALVKEELGIWGEYVERKGDVYSKTFNSKRNPKVLKLMKNKLEERATEVFENIIKDFDTLIEQIEKKLSNSNKK